ncbi:inositol-1,4,5-trisphosphate 5-phosphatase 1 [Physcia stellaris]|nr:inositol-1,4,5-trisphosphate 5-phosphatase 1 [Physcia stellaris]
MPLKLLLREHPQRAIAVVANSHALVFRHSVSAAGADSQASGPSGKISGPRCLVEFSALNAIDLTDYRELHGLTVHGTLGLINVKTDIFLCVITGASRVATVRPGETVQRITSVEFCPGDYDRLPHDSYDPYSGEDVASNGHDYGHGAESQEGHFQHPCFELKRILGSSESFYYSVDFDLTNRLQDRFSEGSAFDLDSLDAEFLWNSYMIDPLIQFRSRLASQEKSALDASHILTSAIRGFVLTITIPASASPVKGSHTNLPSHLTLISRLSCRRAGTRFNSRGIDDDGHVANFVETETILWHPSGLCFSYAQIRGSVPIFWEQAAGLLPNQQKISITRSPEATQPAFDKHFEYLELTYGGIHIVNLLSETKPGEVDLTARYNHHALRSPLNQVIELGGNSDPQILQQTQFDFHAETKGPGGYEAASMVRRLIQDRGDEFAYCLCDGADALGDNSTEEKVRRGATEVLQQTGVFRTNCLDCLDRTNLIQTIISQMALESFLSPRNESASAEFWMRHSSVWADNGDALSKIYAGTGALKTSFTRHGKMSLSGAIADARKSATRMYINNFADKGRQNTIDMLLGRLVDQAPVHLFDPINDFVNAELKRRINEYSTTEEIQIWVGTFNLNGRGSGVKEDLAVWLCPQLNRLQQHPEIVAVGFQEIVELSPQQIMSTDPVRRQAWEDAVRKTLNDNAKKHSSEDYILLRSGQLVGAALMIFVKSSTLKSIKNVEGSVRKTGMSGMAGNKGAVAIRLDYANTRICLVTAHLAAGFANYEERNRDFRTINHGLRFQRNRSIEDHDTIIWLGDFNYRIGLSDDKVRRLIQAGDLETLYANDQLNLQMVAGRTFPFYSEARITFLPTYKYNNGTDQYDTSEKARIPAWCDRVLRKGSNLRQINYTTAPLRFSDHRPVYATFQCTISKVDESVKRELSEEIYTKRRSEIRGPSANSKSDDIDEEDLLGYDPISPGLPPASSDRRRWWLDNGLPARSMIQPPNARSMLNPQRPSNPFTPSPEPDWVTVSPPSSYQGPGAAQMDGARKVSTRQASSKFPTSSPTQTSSVSRAASKGAPPAKARQDPSSQSQAPTAPSTSSVSRKPAPPVPKKPALLSTPSEQAVDTTRSSAAPSQPPSAPKPRPTAEITTVFPPPPRRATGSPSTASPLRQASSRDANGPRRTSRKAPDLMDDDGDDGGAKMIPALQPQRRG